MKMTKSEIIRFSIAISTIVAITIGLVVVLNKAEISDSKQQFNFNVGLVVLDRDNAIDSIYVDKNLKVIDCVTTKK